MLRFLHFFTLVLGMAVMAGCGSSKAVAPVDPNFIAAQEVKLKVRELADQMLASLPNDALVGFVALPTSFVNQNDFNSSSPLGRYLAEGLIYEFNQRGFPVREYRTDGSIMMSEGMGEAALARKGKIATAKGKGNALLIGTYHQDPDAIFVNARLVRSSDGIVLRTGQVLLTPTAVALRMAGTGPGGALPGASASAAAQKKTKGETPSQEPGDGQLFGYTSAAKSGGMQIRQAPPRKISTAAAGTKGLMGYAPE